MKFDLGKIAKDEEKEKLILEWYKHVEELVTSKLIKNPPYMTPQSYLPTQTQLPSRPYRGPSRDYPEIIRQDKIEKFTYKISHLLQYLPEDLSNRLMDGIEFLCKSFERINAR